MAPIVPEDIEMDQTNDYGEDIDIEDVEKLMDPNIIQSLPNAKVESASTFLNDIRMDIDISPVMLTRLFFQRFFPYKPYFQWLNYEITPTKNFVNREFSFSTESTFFRYRSFEDLEELKRELERVQPTKFDIGAVYSVKPKDKKMTRPGVFQPVEKELVFDIDMTDYDDVRNCCSEANICHKCWQFMTIAIKILDSVLREDFGFKHLLWVYSGRRGVHCWVCDDRARKLTNSSRKAIMAYLDIMKGNGKKVSLPNQLHPSLKRSFKILMAYFNKVVLRDQNILGQPENWNKVLQLVPDEGVRGILQQQWEKDPSRDSSNKWNDLTVELENAVSVAKPQRRAILENVKRDIIFQYSYPRLDQNVSTAINHLLKSPFCVHPKTQRICVPIDPKTCDDFDPLEVPTISQLYNEMSKYDEQHTRTENGERKIHDYHKTSLSPYVKHFESFVDGLMKEVREKKRAEASISLNF